MTDTAHTPLENYKARFKEIDDIPNDLANKATAYRYLCLDLFKKCEEIWEVLKSSPRG
jgi:hypothetical protein